MARLIALGLIAVFGAMGTMPGPLPSHPPPADAALRDETVFGHTVPAPAQAQQEPDREPRNVPAMLAGIGLILIAGGIWVLLRAHTRNRRRPPPD